MGRGKIVLKRIEDKASRHVSFSKRRNGLMKKSYELAVLCDIDVAVCVFSGSGRLFEFSTGDRMTEILSRYECFNKIEESESVCINIHENLGSEHRSVSYADAFIEMIQRNLEEDRIQKLDITGFNKLEQQLTSFLQKVRTRETELNMGVLKALKDKETQLKKERKIMMEEIKAAQMHSINDNPGVDGRSE